MEPKRILVLCGGKFAFPTLQTLGMEHFLCGVGIGKGDPEMAAMLKVESEKSRLPFMDFPDKESLQELGTWLNKLQPDYIFSISFPFLLSKDILSYGKEKFINFHPGPLPQYRGPMPLFEVLRYQEKETAVSVHFMNEEFDEGAVIFEEKITITEEETYGSLAVKLSGRTAMVALNVAQMLQFGSSVPSTDQDENTARYFEKPEPIDTFVQWKRMPADEILALIKACNPWNQGADSVFSGRQVKLISANMSDESHTELPGTIVKINEHVISVACLGGKCIDLQIIGGDEGILTAGRFNSAKTKIGQLFN